MWDLTKLRPSHLCRSQFCLYTFHRVASFPGFSDRFNTNSLSTCYLKDSQKNKNCDGQVKPFKVKSVEESNFFPLDFVSQANFGKVSNVAFEIFHQNIYLYFLKADFHKNYSFFAWTIPDVEDKIILYDEAELHVSNSRRTQIYRTEPH